MANEASPVWWVTGTSTGIGRAVVEQVAAAGHRVIATARSLASIQDYPERFGDRVLTVQQDVNHTHDNAAALEAGLRAFGRIDVLMNNAGYGLEGPLEETTLEQVRHQMETNFFGLVDCTKLVIPHMRHQQSGLIANVSSIAGLRGFNGLSIYNASKFAVAGFSEAMRQELRPFNVKVVSIEPGPYKTDWAGRSLQHTEPMAKGDENSPYATLHRTLKQGIDGMSGQQPGDPTQIADVLLSIYAANLKDVPIHLVFGDEAIQMWEDKQKRFSDTTYFDFFPHTRRSL